ncbi:LamG domain-containing protein [Xylanibacter brevis]|uniref:LamG domain-containing protein n=1 Tax=Xylanibacter brevis TaxID=83231 RepID=UPI000ACBB039|nr:LamG domain-containing protein [Xylanibacter brevis]
MSCIVMILLSVAGVQSAMADTWPEYVTDVIVLGGSAGEVEAMATKYSGQGYTVLKYDLNDGAGGDWIWLAYKKSSRANTNGGYITDLALSYDQHGSSATFNGRTYNRAPYDGGSHFKNIYGNLNSNAKGSDIHLFYTRTNFSDKRAVSTITVNNESSGSVGWNGSGSAADMNRGAGGKYIYLHQYTTSKTCRTTTDVEVYSSLTYDCRDQNLIKTAGATNNGTVMYKLDNGSWTSDVNQMKAKKPGNYTVYYYVKGNSYAGDSETKSQRVTLNKGNEYPTPKNFGVANSNSFSKKITLSWEPQTTQNTKTNGKWYIFRNGQKLDEVAYKSSKITYTDDLKDVAYNTTLNYVVAFAADSWYLTTPADALTYTASLSHDFKRTFTFGTLTVKEENSKIKLNWTHSNILDASGTNIYTLYIQRANAPQVGKQPEWVDIDQIDIKSDKTTSGSYTDNSALQSNHTYWYRLKMEVEENIKNSGNATIRLNGSTITGFTASRGNYNNAVKLQWTVDQVGTSTTYFTVQRRPLGSEKESDYVDIYTTSGTAADYSYEDQTALPGSFNEYRVLLREYDENNQLSESDRETADGFSVATGVVSGRVSFNSGTAVQDVKITMRASNADGQNESNFRSLQLTGSETGIQCLASSEKLNEMLDGSFSAQMYVKASNFNGGMTENNKAYQLLNIKDVFTLLLKYDSANQRYQVGAKINGTETWSTDSIGANDWNQLSVVYDNDSLNFYVVNTKNVLKKSQKKVEKPNWNKSGATDKLTLGNNTTFDATNNFKGQIDEFRFFSKALDETEISKNFNHTLSGSEKGLVIYWPMDEGIENGQPVAYDFSKQNGINNGNHGLVNGTALTQTDVPDEDQLSLMTYTDDNGNYTIRGVGFSGEGTSYVITPSLGVHQFSPTNKSRFFSLNSLVHSGVDFEDSSSFPVSGTVYFEHTSIPVADAYLYVDGLMASKDGEPVKTDAMGNYQLDVPIGDHFIQVKKNGHTFVNDGRYPNDPNGIGRRENFDGAKTGLTFYDNTLVMVAGRVAGGDLENQKPLGLYQGKNNIGQATLTLSLENENIGLLNLADPDPNSTVSNNNVNENARIFDTAFGEASVPGKKNFITVKTDAETGEWAAMLPPLRYVISEVIIPSNNAITKSDFSLPTIDASNPSIVYTDSIENGSNGYERFNYQASAKLEYRSESTIEVKEHENGAFGIEDYKIKDLSGKERDVKVYTIDNNGRVNYTFGYPVYQELDTYTYDIHAYERYENKDNAQEIIVDEVPLAGSKVTIKNQYAATTSVLLSGEVHEMKDDELELDSVGQATYQFTVGYPNIQSPYTRGLSISYEIGGIEKSWSGNNSFKAIVLGGLPTGNNFVTEGPDEILMVLRDPPGTGSSATWSRGSSVSKSKSVTVEPHSETSVNTTIYAGVEQATAEGIGFMVIQDLESKVNIEAGAEVNVKWGNTHGTTTTITATRDISTSGESDFVGAVGDVFIGSSKNIIFGACNAVDIRWDETANKAKLSMEAALATGDQFTTGFAYTQNYITGVLIPNFITLRNGLLRKVNNIASVARPKKGEDPIYVTLLNEDDANFGTSNNDKDVWGDKAVTFDKLKDGIYSGPSYTMILPEDYKNNNYQDKVNFYNLQINKWENELRKNEEAKVTAIQNSTKYLKENHSFDAGASITVSTTNEKASTTKNEEEQEINAIIGLETGFRFTGVGLGVHVEEKVGVTITEEQETEETETVTTSYSLVEDGDDDYLTVDVFDAPDGFGPIFYTRGGATCCPYEDEVVTEYYKPGTVISEKTVQIEKPEIEAQSQLVTGIPAGGVGTLVMAIRNNSDTKEDGWYNINVVPESNPDGLVVTMDGLNITGGHAIMVRAGETMYKTFSIKQSNLDVLNYKNVKVRISSQCQPDDTGVFPEIADTTEFSVFFQPACSDIKLSSTHTLVNSDTESAVKLSISGYNYSMASLQGIRLQYKSLSDADFITLQEYAKDADRVAADKNLLLLPALEGTNTLDYIVDLRDKTRFADKTYIFRAITVCMQGGVEVNNESEEITVTRDMSRPMLIATPTPSSGVLGIGDDLAITFNEDIQGSILNSADNFTVAGILNETEVTHDVALSLTGENAAKTDNTMNLSGKSFSTGMWINYSNNGRVLMHGTNDNHFSIDIVNGKLVVAVNDSKAQSDAVLPTNKWLYLNVSYNADDNTVSAGYAQDAATVSLITNEKIDAYQGNGPIVVGGNNLTAKVQELTIWNDSRSMAQAQAEMYTTKSQFTSGLIGYWPLDEGHGEVAVDKARSRNITLPSTNAWWINGDNYAVALDGTKAATVDISTLNTTEADDYLVETWFKANEQQSGKASVLGTQAMDLRLNAEGKLEIELPTAGTETSVATVLDKDLRDGQWHHIAMNVLKGANGGAVIYVDGQQRKMLSASAVPALYGDKLMLGAHRKSIDGQGLYTYDQLLKGAIDEVRIWKGRRTADVIKNNMYNRMKADEAGLVAYYPMERSELDAYRQLVVNSTMKSLAGEPAELAFFTAGAKATSGSVSKDNTAALKQAPTLTNVQFNFVASERQIKVNLTEQPYKLEGCNITLTVKGVKDMHGNVCDPISWSVFVQQNNLKWKEQEIALTKAGKEPKTFTATIENQGSQTETWSLSGMPEWIETNEMAGTLSPLTSKTLTFAVADGLPIGTYETTIYLAGSQEIATPLNITITSEGDAPNWVATTDEHSMTVVGQLKIDNLLSSDPMDMVAAFRGTECVGVAHPQYLSRYDSYMVMMSIYGKEDAELTYKAYDASTGIIYPAVSLSDTEAYTFSADKAVGTFKKPVIFTPTNEIEQDLSMSQAGWKWFSLYAAPVNANPSVIFKDAKDAIYTLTDGRNTIINWHGNMNFSDCSIMYKLNAKTAYKENFIGTPTDPTNTSITLNKNSWSWIGYPAQASNGLSAAFAGAQPEEGDIVKSQTAFAIYTDGDWVGNLTAVTPGEGYLYKSEAATNKTFTYPKPAVSGRKNVARRVAQHNGLRTHQHGDNMTMIATVMDGDQLVEDAEVSIYAGTDLRGLSGQAVTDGKHFIVIDGKKGQADMLTFVVKTTEGEYYLTQTELFEADANMGSVAAPYVLQLDEATSIASALNGLTIKSVVLYDAGGRQVANATKAYTKHDLKNMSEGVYFQQIFFDNGQTRIMKITR